MPYQYSMVQIPPDVSVRGAERGQEAAQYLQNLVNEQARQGWEFHRVDEIGAEVRPGCLLALIGQKGHLHAILCGHLPKGIPRLGMKFPFKLD